MTKRLWWRGASAIVAVLLFMVVVIMAQRVGRLSIRSLHTELPITMEVQQPVVLGVPMTVTWTAPTEVVAVQGEVQLHTGAGKESLGQVALDAGQIVVTIPCAVEREASLLLVEAQSQAVLAQIELSLLPPGEDCALR